MFITDQYIVFADAVSEDGTDYGTGYYLTQKYSDGGMDYFGPYNYVEDAPLSHTNNQRIF